MEFQEAKRESGGDNILGPRPRIFKMYERYLTTDSRPKELQQRTQGTPRGTNKKESSLRHIRLKLNKIKDREKDKCSQRNKRG